MDSKTGKSKRRRVRKTRVKQPDVFTLRMTKILGDTYLENSRGINIAIVLIIVLVVVFILLLALEPAKS